MRLDLVQSNGALTTAGPGTWDSPPWAGTIDEATGAFHLEYGGAAGFGCETFTFDGTVAADGRTFTGTLHYGRLVQAGCASYDDCVMATVSVTGTRCGNQQIDPGEECDFGDAADGDCCSSTCLLAAAGDSCTPDGTECTSDQCSASGTCEHIPVSGPCLEPNGCGSGVCASGACEVTAPASAGTPCDRDDSICTSDVCDDAGSCTAGEQLPCWPCGRCDAQEGCIRDPNPCDGEVLCDEAGTESLNLKLKTSEQSRRKRLRLQFETPVLDPGNPVDGATAYALCVYADDGEVARTIFRAVVPAGGTCEGEACWSARTPLRMRYRDKPGTAGGISSIDAAWDGFRWKGSGANLALAATLPTSSTLEPRVIAWESGDFYERRCWSHTVLPLRQTDGLFRGEFRAD